MVVERFCLIVAALQDPQFDLGLLSVRSVMLSCTPVQVSFRFSSFLQFLKKAYQEVVVFNCLGINQDKGTTEDC